MLCRKGKSMLTAWKYHWIFYRAEQNAKWDLIEL